MADTPHPASRNIERVARLEREQHAAAGPGTRLSLIITDAAGTPRCAAFHLALFTSWMAWNALAPPALRFDPYPFGLLTMAVSMEGVLLAILVLITQNRMSAQSDRRDHLDLQVNLLAEQEMTVVLRLLARITERLGLRMDEIEAEDARKLMDTTDIDALIRALGQREEDKSEGPAA
jgi:uncharacterized membrane protein